MEKERVDKLGQKWRELMSTKKEAEGNLKTIEDEILEVAEKKDSGKVTVEGTEFGFDVTYKESTSYPKEELEGVLAEMEDEVALKLFRVDFKERKAEVDKFLEAGGEQASSLKEIRTVKAGKPSVKLTLIQ